MLAWIKNAYNGIPKPLRVFVVRAAIIFIVWRSLYYFVLGPTQIPDVPLIEFIVFCTSKLLALFYDQITVVGHNIFINGVNVMRVARACNGLELMALYTGFLICVPTNAKRFWTYAAIGPVMIIGLNILRCAALGYLYYNGHQFADFAHHYVFKLVIYGAIFFLWVQYSKKHISYGQ